MAGQFGYFRNYAKEKIEHAIDRYANEYDRLCGVMDRRLADRDYLAGEYSIADMASLPWARAHDRLGQSVDEFPNLARWLERMGERPAVTKAYEIGLDWFRTKANLIKKAARTFSANLPAASPIRLKRLRTTNRAAWV